MFPVKRDSHSRHHPAKHFQGDPKKAVNTQGKMQPAEPPYSRSKRPSQDKGLKVKLLAP